MRKDHRSEADKSAAQPDSDEAVFRAFLIASLVSLALLTLFVGLVAR